jgi:biopolymer transport protein ExbD
MKSSVASLLMILGLATAAAGAEITVSAAGKVALDGKACDWIALDRAVLAAKDVKEFRIVADSKTPWRTVRFAASVAKAKAPVVFAVAGVKGSWRPTLRREKARGLWLEFKREGETTLVLSRSGTDLGQLMPAGGGKALIENILEFVEWNDTGGVVITAKGDPTYEEVVKLAVLCVRGKVGETVVYAGAHPLESPPEPPKAGAASPETIEVAVPTIAKSPAAVKPKEEFVEVVLTKSREIHFGGRTHDEKSLAIALSPHAVKQARKVTEEERRRNPFLPALSDTPLLLRADEAALWQEVVTVMRSCVHPDVLMARVFWRVKDGEGAPAVLAMPLGAGAGMVRIDPKTGEPITGPKTPVTLRIGMIRKWGSSATRIEIQGKPGKPEDLAAHLRSARKPGRRLIVELDAWGSVPFGEVAVVCAACGEADGIGFVSPRGRSAD